ncbi:MAG: class I SAM-dependent methyltransferase [Candidatus Omnitrophica bacterium]|nr:class I SAM-dependent methyltransferase [Candidatus Omnitrophota bacterium]
MTLSLKHNEIEDFYFNGQLPYANRLFFIQHLAPYVFFNPTCRNKKILEIGIGDGFGTYYLSKGADSMVGLDMDIESCRSLSKYALRRGATALRSVNANALALPFKDRSFDHAITCQVIEHIQEDNLSLFLKEIYRVLVPGGSCLIVTLNVENNIKNPKTYEKFYQHHKEFNKKELGALLRTVFSNTEIFGLEVTIKHRFFRRLKKWGLNNYRLGGLNPVAGFYRNILPRDFFISRRVTKHSLDLIGLCRK